MTVGKRARDGERVPLRGDDGAAFQDAAQTLDVSGGPVGKIAERTLPDLAVLAVALAQENGRGRVPVWDGFDIHGGTST